MSEDLTSITWKLKDGPALVGRHAGDRRGRGLHLAVLHRSRGRLRAGCRTSSDVTNVEAVDPQTIKVTFGAPKPFPYGPLRRRAVADPPEGAVRRLPRRRRRPTCTEANTKPIGTGPFMVTDFKANDVVTLAANPNYRDPAKPAFATVVLKGGGDAASAARSVLETGEFDYAWNAQVEPEILAQMPAAGQGRGRSRPSARWSSGCRSTRPIPTRRSATSARPSAHPHPFLTDPNVVQGAVASPSTARSWSRPATAQAGQADLQPGAGAGDQRLDEQRRWCLTQDIERRQQAARRRRLDDGRGRRARQGRQAAVDPLPDLDQLGAPGGAGADQAVVERDRRRGRAAQHRRRRSSSAATRARPTRSRSSTPTSRCTPTTSTAPTRRSTSATGSATRSRARRPSGRAATRRASATRSSTRCMAELAKTAGARGARQDRDRAQRHDRRTRRRSSRWCTAAASRPSRTRSAAW